MANLSVNTVVLTVVSVAVGLIMIGSLLGPIAADVMSDLTDLGGDGANWADLVGVTVVMSILALIVLAINSYTKSK